MKKKWIVILFIFIMAIVSVIVYNNANKKYTSDLAIENGDYVNIHGKIYNDQAMIDFIENVLNKEQDEIRTVVYTVEGDPIITDFNYNGSIFIVVKDNSYDRYSSGGTIKKEFSNLLTYEHRNRLYYSVTNLLEITQADIDNGFDEVILKYDR